MAATLTTCTTIEQRGFLIFLWAKIWMQQRQPCCAQDSALSSNEKGKKGRKD
jgi:hypothetical protein